MTRARIVALLGIMVVVGVIAWEQMKPFKLSTIRVSGRVVDGLARPLPGTTVRLVVPEYNQKATFLSRADGTFEFKTISRGNIGLRFDRMGYRHGMAGVSMQHTGHDAHLGNIVLELGGPGYGPVFPIYPGSPKFAIQTTSCELVQNPWVFDGKLISLHTFISSAIDVPPELYDHRCPSDTLLKVDPWDLDLVNSKGFRDYQRIMTAATPVEATVTGVYKNEPEKFGINTFSSTFELRSISDVAPRKMDDVFPELFQRPKTSRWKR